VELSDIPSVQEIHDKTTGWLVDGLIPMGSLTLLTAPPAGYKTWLALALGGAVSKGADFLDRKTLKTPVVYLDRENRLSVIRDRLGILNLDDRDFLKIWGRWLEDDPPLIGDPRLLEIARRYRPLIIIDSFVRFHSAEENNATQMAKVLEDLLCLVNAGATVVVLHHEGKTPGSRYRGSTDILAGVDAAFAIVKKTNKDGTILTFHCYKHRQVEEFDMTLRPDLKNGRFEVVDDPSTAASLATIERIKETIGKNPGLTQKELMDKAHLPETRGRSILQQGEGVDWYSSRGTGKTRHYHLKPQES
jgi:hypothetical protein